MKLMKKLSLLGLVLVLASSMMACNEANAEPHNNSSQTTSQTSVEDTAKLISTEESTTARQTQAQTQPSPEIKELPEIQADLDAKKTFGDDVIIDTLTLIKRQTRIDDLIDTVFVTAEAHNDKVKFVRSMKLTYGLYNEGWILDSIEDYMEGDNSVEPTKGPDSSVVDTYFERLNAEMSSQKSRLYNLYTSWEVKNQNTDLASSYADLYIYARREAPLWCTNEYFELQCFFDYTTWEWEVSSTLDHTINFDFSKMCSQEYRASPSDPWYANSWVSLTIWDVDYDNMLINIDCKYSDNKGKVTDYSGIYSFTKDESDWRNPIMIVVGSKHIKINPNSIWFEEPLIRLFDESEG